LNRSFEKNEKKVTISEKEERKKPFTKNASFFLQTSIVLLRSSALRRVEGIGQFLLFRLLYI